MKRTTHRQQGFTLVELAVVLAVIGLIVGGILAGASYMHNAERTSAINEVKGYINAFNQFQNKYGTTPGDKSDAASTWTGASNGDGNGFVRAPAGTNNVAEIFYVWQHLSMSGVISGQYSGVAGPNGNWHGVITGTDTTSPNLPHSAISDVGYYFNYPDNAVGGLISSDATYFDGFYNHFLRMAIQPATGNSPPASAFLTPREAFEIDDKYDDARPASGWIRALKPAAMPNCATASDSTAQYNNSYRTKACSFIMLQQ